MQLTVNNFEAETSKYDAVVVMFFASWCSKCAIMKPVVGKIENRCKEEVKFFLVDVDRETVLATRYGVEIVPMFLMLKMGEPEGIMSGVIQEKAFEKRIRDIFNMETAT